MPLLDEEVKVGFGELGLIREDPSLRRSAGLSPDDAWERILREHGIEELEDSDFIYWPTGQWRFPKRPSPDEAREREEFWAALMQLYGQESSP